ncbi:MULTISPECIES: extradiol ring-cleavage dioxygenase [Sphingobium]|uniref:DODA-type extradiol aromatic ring-opening family dioxygenase n=1 Tax=Sphingobium TaxID=165695 RepID=UPI00159C8254|nr:extradiol ring-cleavage dioxygenase [Sphingobium sp. 15-1]
MAEIILGICTSHSPLLTFDAGTWRERAEDDKRNPELTLSDGRSVTYDQLLLERGPRYAAEAGVASLEAQAAKTGPALDRLAAEVRAARPDVVLIVGDDQEELYKAGNTPALAIYYGDEVVMRPLGEIVSQPPSWMEQAIGGYAMETTNRFPGAPDFALRLVEGLMDAGVDLGVASSVNDPRKAAFGHAFGFVARRLLDEGKVPVVPILLNTYYPPNVIRPGRCYLIGELMRQVVEAMPDSLRVAVVASGGLSHFVTDEALDLQVLEALKQHDRDALGAVPMEALRAGSSEILCWIMAGGAFSHLRYSWSEYMPVYRTEAGTGIGLGFGVWK